MTAVKAVIIFPCEEYKDHSHVFAVRGARHGAAVAELIPDGVSLLIDRLLKQGARTQRFNPVR